MEANRKNKHYKSKYMYMYFNEKQNENFIPSSTTVGVPSDDCAK